MDPECVSQTKDGDPLQTKYYCRIDNSQRMSVVMEMVPSGGEILTRLPLQYVLVIDVSGSMQTQVGNQQETLLQRVKTFADLAVQKMTKSDSLAIVTFSDDFVIEMRMSVMNDGNKKRARDRINKLEVRGSTNIEEGLMGALETIDRNPLSRYCVILFTDGNATDGEKNPELLIRKYRKRQSDIGLRSCVPVSAFTIGGYQPELLIEISKELGSESFYWLNDDEKGFEANMLIPLFLRERTSISDVDITLEALDNTYFDPVDENAAHFTGKQCNNVHVKRNEEPTKLFFFIHSLPEDNPKTILFHVVVPQMPPEVLNGKRVVNIVVHYLDVDLRRRTIRDHILISTKSLLETRSIDHAASKNIVAMSVNLMKVSAFVMTRNEARTSWKDAQESIVKVSAQKCRNVTVASIANAIQNLRSDSHIQWQDTFQAARDEITTIHEETAMFLPDGGQYLEWITQAADVFMSTINEANCISATNDARNYSKLSSMASSLLTEMPTSDGVFGGKQPFMSANLEEKLLEEKQILEVIGRLRSGEKINVEVTKQRMQLAIQAGRLDEMMQCHRELKALFSENYIGNEFLEYVEREIAHRKELDGVKRKLDSALKIEDFVYVAKLLDEMKRLRAKNELTFTGGDESAFRKTLSDLTLYQRKRVVMAEIANTMPLLDLPVTPQNMEKLTQAIEQLIHLKSQAKELGDAFTERDNTLLNHAIEKVGAARKQMDSITRRITEMKPALSLPEHPSNYEEISEAAKKMNSLQIESQKFEGLFSEHDEQLLRAACDRLYSLDVEKNSLLERIKNVIPVLDFPMIPMNYQTLRDAVDNMTLIRQRAVLFKDLFLPEYEMKFNQASEKVATLLKMKEDLMDKVLNELEEIKPGLKVEMTPNNLNYLKSSVERMKSLKEESAAFDGVFTAADESDLFEAATNLKHLTANVDKMHKARYDLEQAVEGRDYAQLKRAVKRASRAPFIERSELKEPRKLLSFLDPEKRRAAVKNAIELEDIEEIEEALSDMNKACVADDKLEEEAGLMLKKLQKQKRKEDRRIKRKEKQMRRRKRQMKRIEAALKEAMENRDVDSLEQALEDFESGGFDELEVPLAKEAKQLLRHLKIEIMRNRLLEGVRTRNVELLYSALMDAKYGNYEEHMQAEYSEAEKLLTYLLEMMRLRDEIVKLTRAGISEVHSYNKPPIPIKKTMRAIFTILGETYEGIKTWEKIQALLGKLDRNSITKRVQRFKIKDLSPETAEKAERFMGNLKLEEVEIASKVAATFYAWAKYVVKEVEHFKEMSDKKSREEARETEINPLKSDHEDFESDGQN